MAETNKRKIRWVKAKASNGSTYGYYNTKDLDITVELNGSISENDFLAITPGEIYWRYYAIRSNGYANNNPKGEPVDLRKIRDEFEWEAVKFTEKADPWESEPLF